MPTTLSIPRECLDLGSEGVTGLVSREGATMPGGLTHK
jgi:hypothetical protein